MYPTCYSLSVTAHHHRLYLGSLPTIDGLRLFPPTTPCRFEHLYTDGDEQIPPNQNTVQSVADAINFLESLDDGSPVDFQCTIGSDTTLSTHDDAECHLAFATSDEAQRVVRHVAPAPHADKLWASLSENPGSYVICDPHGALGVYPDFDAFLAAQNET